MIGILITLIIVVPIAIYWAKNIDHMSKNHPDYKGDELFGKFDEDDKDNIL